MLSRSRSVVTLVFALIVAVSQATPAAAHNILSNGTAHPVAQKTERSFRFAATHTIQGCSNNRDGTSCAKGFYFDVWAGAQIWLAGQWRDFTDWVKSQIRHYPESRQVQQGVTYYCHPEDYGNAYHMRSRGKTGIKHNGSWVYSSRFYSDGRWISCQNPNLSRPDSLGSEISTEELDSTDLTTSFTAGAMEAGVRSTLLDAETEEEFADSATEAYWSAATEAIAISQDLQRGLGPGSYQIAGAGADEDEGVVQIIAMLTSPIRDSYGSIAIGGDVYPIGCLEVLEEADGYVAHLSAGTTFGVTISDRDNGDSVNWAPLLGTTPCGAPTAEPSEPLSVFFEIMPSPAG